MRLLIDLQHPAHVHFFRHLVARMTREGHEVKLTGRNKDILTSLADEFGLDVDVFGTARPGVLNLGKELLSRQIRLWRIMRDFQPDLALAIAGTFISPVSWLRRTPVFVFYDTEHARMSNLIAYPPATCVFVPASYRRRVRSRHVRYQGYQELAYLHPSTFTPDPTVLEEVGLGPDDPFSLVRFVSWEAGHDIGLTGFTEENRRRAVEELERFGRVLVSAEGALPPDLEGYRLRLSPSRVHDLMARSRMVFGESATMCTEGAVLGVPGIYVDPVGRGYIDELQRRGLAWYFPTRAQEGAIEAIPEVMALSADQLQDRRRLLLDETIDVGEFLYEVVTGHQHYC